jgi:peptidoglycan/xylan/chitin deacetylase (PgdA/CDA1 family)
MKRALLLVVVVTLLFSAQADAGRIALSFDDAPRRSRVFSGSEKTAKLIEELKKAGVKEAVFYCNPGRDRDEDWRARLTAYANAGHALANHTATHPSLPDVPTKDYIASIARADELLSSIPGYRRWFRYPFLREGRKDRRKHDAVKAYLKEQGYRFGYVTIEIYDWHIESRLWEALDRGDAVDYEKLKALYLDVIRDSARFYEALAVKALGYLPVHVILLHENDLNALFIADVVTMLRHEGFTIVPASKAFDDPIADAKWDADHYSMRRLRAIAVNKGIDAEATKPRWQGTESLDRLISDRGVFTKR